MNQNLSLYRIFYTVARSGNISRAADELFISQPAVSKAVRKPGTKMSISDRIDSIVTSRILGLPIFAAVMVFVYYVTVTTVGTVMTDWTNDSFVVAYCGRPEVFFGAFKVPAGHFQFFGGFFLLFAQLGDLK